MNKLAVVCLLLSGCASSPYLEPKFEWQIDSWSDWVLQSERPWTPDEHEPFLKIETGLAWDYGIDCPAIEWNAVGPWEQMFVACWWHWGGKQKSVRPIVGVGLMHQIDSRTEDFLNTDQNQWQSHNPFLHLRAGVSVYDLNVYLRTGKGLLQGAPFESENDNPDIYWTNFGVSYRFWGRDDD